MYTNTSHNLMLRDEAFSTLQSRRPGDSPSGENQANQVISNQDYMPLNPATKLRNWEISREYVQISKVIGTGSFSQVAKALAWNINGIKGLTTVAVKMLKGMCIIYVGVFKEPPLLAVGASFCLSNFCMSLTFCMRAPTCSLRLSSHFHFLANLQ